MPFEVQQASSDDIPELVQAFHDAFAEDVIMIMGFGDVPDDIRRKADIDHFTGVLDRDGAHFF